MAKSLLDRILDEIFDADWVGRQGERLTERKLKWLRLLGRKGKILRNVYVPKDNGETSEIDMVFITRKGIFVIESKNYSGWIFGDEKSLQWTQTLSRRDKIRFYNPVKQNATHMKWLQKYLADGTPLFSLIVFSERCELKKIDVDSPDVKVIKRDQLYETVSSIWKEKEDVISEEQVREIYARLQELTHVSKSVKKAHIEAIREKYESGVFAETAATEEETGKEAEREGGLTGDRETNGEEAEEPEESMAEETAVQALEETAAAGSDLSEEAALEAPRCPVCGGLLVVRMAKKGANAGNSFYGCSNFPKCRYTKNI